MLEKDHQALGENGIEYFRFWNSGNIKRHFTTCEGRIYEDIKYNKDGSKKEVSLIYYLETK